MLFPVHRMWDLPSLYHGEEGNQSWKQKEEEEAAGSNGATKSAKQYQPLGLLLALSVLVHLRCNLLV